MIGRIEKDAERLLKDIRQQQIKEYVEINKALFNIQLRAVGALIYHNIYHHGCLPDEELYPYDIKVIRRAFAKINPTIGMKVPYLAELILFTFNRLKEE